MKIEQRLQYPKCLKYLEKLAINNFSWIPYCPNCNTKWKIFVNCEDELKITYEEEFDVAGLSNCNGFKSENTK